MELHTFVVLIWLVHVSFGFRQDITDCPSYRPTCSRGNDSVELFESLVSEHQKHCCVCRCTDDCLYLGNCCEGNDSDVTSVGIENQAVSPRGEMCSKAVVSGDSRKFAPVIGGMSYLMVKTCLAYFSDARTIENCMNSPVTIEGVTPVYNTRDNVHYANIFCAKCNLNVNESDLLHWESEIICETGDSLLDNLGQQTADNMLLNLLQGTSCALIFRSTHEPTLCIREEDIVSRCHIGTLNNHPCVTEPKNLFLAAGVVFRNTFCYECNPNAHTTVCLGSGQPTFSFSMLSFAALIDFNRFQSSNSQQSNNPCGDNLVYNALLGGCLNIICPPGTRKNNGTCAGYIFDVRYLTVNLRLKVQHKKADNEFNADFDVEMTTVQHLIKAMGVKNVVICHTALFEVEPLPVLLVRYKYILNIVLLFDKVSTIQDVSGLIKHWLHQINENAESTIIVEMSQPSLRSKLLDEMTFFSFKEVTPLGIESVTLLGCNQTGIAFSDLQFCEAVLLHKSEFNVTSGYLYIRDVFFTTNEYVLRTVKNSDEIFAQICLTKYISRILPNVGIDTKVTVEETNVNVYISAYYFQSSLDINILTFVCTMASLVSLVILILTYLVLGMWKPVPTRNTFILATNLLVAQCLFQFGITQTEISWLCQLLGMLTHYSWLCYMFWMLVCMYAVFYTFVIRIHYHDNTSEQESYSNRLIFTYVCPLIFVLSNVLYSIISDRSTGYGHSLCYISRHNMIAFTFVLPIGIIVIVNVCLFVTFVVKMRKMTSDMSDRYPGRRQGLANFTIYLKVSSLTGLTWTIAFLYTWTRFYWLEYLFVILNASNGVILMLSFLGNRTVFDNIKSKFRHCRKAHN